MNRKQIVLLIAVLFAIAGIVIYRFPNSSGTARSLLEARHFDADIKTTIPGKTVKWKNKQYFMESLNRMGFWDNNKIVIDPNKAPVTVDHITLILADRVTSKNVLKKTDKEGNEIIVMSHEYEYNPSTRGLRITQYVNPEAFRPAPLKPITIDKQYGLAVLYSMFQLRVSPELSNKQEDLMKRVSALDEEFFAFSRNDTLFTLQ